MTGRSDGPLLGRDAELERLHVALADVRDGAARTLLLGGDAGVGKTRLVTEFVRSVRGPDVRTLIGGATDLAGGDLPFAPVAAAVRSLVREEELAGRLLRLVPPPLRPLVPELRLRDERAAWSGAPSETGRLAVFGGVLGLLVELAEARPVVLVLEDMHWADDSTRDLLAFLALHLGDVPVLVVVTYRTDELHRTHPLRPALAELSRLPSVSSIELAPLPPALVAELCRDLAGGTPPPDVVDDVVARSQGNPFAVEELVRAHAGGFRGLPASISELLLLRLEEVSTETLAVLRLIAMVGRPVDHELLAALSDEDEGRLEQALRPAIERHLVVADGPGYRLRHALLAEAIVGTLLPGERRRLHHRVAETLTARPGLRSRTTPLAELAHHRHLAGDVPEAVVVAYDAAAEVEPTGAYGEAARLLSRVLEHWDEVEDAETLLGATRREVLARAAELSYCAGDAAQAIRLCRAAMEDVDPASEPVAAGLLHERLGRYRWVASVEEDVVLATYEQAVALVPTAPSPERARVLAAHGQALMLVRRFAEAVERCREALGIAARTGARSVEGHARNSLGVSLAHLGRVEEGLDELRRALEIASDLGDLDEVGRVQANTSEALWMAGRVDDVVALAEEALGAGDGSRGAAIGGWHLPCIAGVAAEALALRGGWERSLALVDRYRWPGHGYGGRWLGIAAAGIELARGDVEAAASYLAEADAARGSLDVQTRPRALLVHAGLAAARGDDVSGSAGILLDELEEASGIEYLTLVTVSQLAVLLDSLPATEERGRLLSRSVAVGQRAFAAVTERADPVVTLRLAVARLRAVAAEGRAAADAWGEVASLAASAGFVPAEAHARARRGELLVAEADDREQAAADLAAALAAAEELGAAPIAGRVRATAARARLTLDGAARPGGPAGLTPREVEVLGLVAAGLTNPEIGRRLHISEKTASVHVSRILRKLEVSNRVEAAVRAQRLGLDGAAAGS